MIQLELPQTAISVGEHPGARLVRARQIAAVATASLLVAAAFSVPAAHGAGQGSAGLRGCGRARRPRLAARAVEGRAPARRRSPWSKPFEGELSLTAPDGTVAAKSRERAGRASVFLVRRGRSTGRGGVARHARARGRARRVRHHHARRSPCSGKQPPAPARDAKAASGRCAIAGTAPRENLYSAWIEKLFDAPLDAAPSWPALHEVLRDKSRNILFNHLGLGEDEKKLIIQPDCADLPYFLRAYFAFKMGLPFGYSKCSRGGGGAGAEVRAVVEHPEGRARQPLPRRRPPPTAASSELSASRSPVRRRRLPRRPSGLVPGFGYYVRTTVANGVHSGNGRTALDDDNTDYYPVPLKQERLRPGPPMPIPMGTRSSREAHAGDGASAAFSRGRRAARRHRRRKRFWRGNFLFALDPSLGGHGFEHFRPLVAQKRGTPVRRRTNHANADPEYADSRSTGDARRRGILRPHGRRDLAGAARPSAAMRRRSRHSTSRQRRA